MSPTLIVLDISIVSSRSTMHTLSLIFFRILYVPYFVWCSLLLVPSGNLFFLKNTITMSPSLNNFSSQYLSAAFFYLALGCSSVCLISACTFYTYSVMFYAAMLTPSPYKNGIRSIECAKTAYKHDQKETL